MPESSKQSFTEFAEQANHCENINSALQYFTQSHQLNSTLLLFSLWFAQQKFGKLQQAQTKSMQQNIDTWHTEITLSLDALLNITAHCKAKKMRRIETGIRDCITNATRSEQKMLLDASPSNIARNNKRPLQQLNDACHNIKNYLKLCRVSFSTADQSQLVNFVASTFSELTKPIVLKTISSIFHTDTPYPQQLSLISPT